MHSCSGSTAVFELHAITDGLYESLKGALIYIFIACYFIVKSTYNPWFDASETQSVSDLTGSLPFHDLEHNQVSFLRYYLANIYTKKCIWKIDI